MLELLELLALLGDLVIRWRFGLSFVVAIALALLVFGRLFHGVFGQTLAVLTILAGIVFGIAWEYRAARKH